MGPGWEGRSLKAAFKMGSITLLYVTDGQTQGLRTESHSNYKVHVISVTTQPRYPSLNHSLALQTLLLLARELPKVGWCLT